MKRATFEKIQNFVAGMILAAFCLSSTYIMFFDNPMHNEVYWGTILEKHSSLDLGRSSSVDEMFLVDFQEVGIRSISVSNSCYVEYKVGDSIGWYFTDAEISRRGDVKSMLLSMYSAIGFVLTLFLIMYHFAALISKGYKKFVNSLEE